MFTASRSRRASRLNRCRMDGCEGRGRRFRRPRLSDASGPTCAIDQVQARDPFEPNRGGNALFVSPTPYKKSIFLLCLIAAEARIHISQNRPPPEPKPTRKTRRLLSTSIVRRRIPGLRPRLATGAFAVLGVALLLSSAIFQPATAGDDQPTAVSEKEVNEPLATSPGFSEVPPTLSPWVFLRSHQRYLLV